MRFRFRSFRSFGFIRKLDLSVASLSPALFGRRGQRNTTLRGFEETAKPWKSEGFRYRLISFSLLAPFLVIVFFLSSRLPSTCFLRRESFTRLGLYGSLGCTLSMINLLFCSKYLKSSEFFCTILILKKRILILKKNEVISFVINFFAERY